MLENLKFYFKELEHKYFYEKPSESFRKKLINKLPDLEELKLKSDYETLNDQGILILPQKFKK